MSKQKQAPAASLKRRKPLLGLPIHIIKVSILLNIGYYRILVLNRLLYINYIEFPSRKRNFPSRIRDFPIDFADFPREQAVIGGVASEGPSTWGRWA